MQLLTFLFVLFVAKLCDGQSLNFTALCEECDMTTGAGYMHHPIYCHLFIQCTQGKGDSLQAMVKECPRGLLWSQKHMQCVWPEVSDCKFNPCDKPGVKVRDQTRCNGYFSCENGIRIKYLCCDGNQRFDETNQMCVEDVSCNPACKPNSWKDGVGRPDCDKFAHPFDKRRYLWKVNLQNVTMLCAAGTVYSKILCGCEEDKEKKDTGICEQYLYFPFDKNKEDAMANSDTGGSDLWIEHGVSGARGSGALHLNGNEHVIVWALNNMDFGSKFLLKFRFKANLPQDNGGDRFAIIDNSDCNKEATFGVAMLRTGVNRVSLFGGFKLVNNEFVTARVEDVPTSSWHDIVLLKDGPRAELIVDGMTYAMDGRDADLSPSIAQVDCAMTIGKGTELRNYAGYIDEVSFYKCVPDEYQMPIL